MANIKITEMPQAISVGGDDIIPIVQGGVNKQASKNLFDTYSTSEQVVGKWINGKPLYKRTYQLTTVASPSSSQNIITFSNVDEIIEVTGFVVASPSTYFIPYYYSNTAYVQAYRNSTTSIKFLCGSSYGFGETTATILYTKTTDSAS